MKQNKYDDEVFFEKYSRMPRSQKGLEGAGEWHALRQLLPNFAGRRVLDLGCGYGWHCRYAAEGGAACVLGTDISEKMLEVARRKTSSRLVEYRRMAIEDMDVPAASFDVVLSSLAFHYVQDFEALAGRIWQALTPGGDFVFSAEHPVFTAQGRQDWLYDEAGNILCWPVDRYFDQSARDAIFLGESVRKYHRSLEGYLMPLLRTGFVLRAVAEPMPPRDMMQLPGMANELRRPMMLLVAAQKPGA